jgi:hypothetical protein
MAEAAVSTIIPTYNRADFIGRAIESVLAACNDGDEIIVVDDGSTDNTLQAIEQFRDRITVVQIPRSGAGAARNAGIRQARNDLIAFLDSDDEWNPDKLRIQKALMRKEPDIVFSFSDFAATDESGTEYHGNVAGWSGDNREWSEILDERRELHVPNLSTSHSEPIEYYTGSMYLPEMTASYVAAITLMVRRSAAGDAFEFAEDLPLYEDWYCAGRLSGKGTAAFLNIETAWQRASAKDRLTHAGSLQMSEARIAVLERVWGRDQSFLKIHGEQYRSTLAVVRQELVKDLILDKQYERARKELSLIESSPLSLRALLSLPDWSIGPVMRLKSIGRRAGRSPAAAVQ